MKNKIPWILLAILLIATTTLACRLSPFAASPITTLQPTPTLKALPAQATPAASAPGEAVSLTERDQILADLYDRVSPGVVSIRIITQDGSGQGSGFVYDQEGHIVTNYHVVEGAQELEVDFSSGQKVHGDILATDLDSDLAIIQVDVPAADLTPLTLGDSDQLHVGQTVVAIGNPFGLSGTMTIGIVSAKGRTLESLREADNNAYFTAGDIIQTDAAINPGNSGGPLLNLAGEVIGLNRAIRTESSTDTGEPVNTGIGFAISSKIMSRVVPVLIKDGKYEYPYLGITSQDELSLFLAEELKLPQTSGAYVTSVRTDSPADKAGIRGGSVETTIPDLLSGGDLIIAVDGQPVQVFGDLLSYLMTSKSPGDSIVLTILRDGEQKEVTVILGKRP
ncbi:trypsin-like serine protease, typically periplasmic, contain C-terminal PDZ domain [Longilinea arvoryzae]|uniref:Trypsin-like serine protease, typically periplasmic, contain C-terminal PDZ domain n=1 Tax=Longilinea arvoryzae TaxID=360412 RepID=A0A0S7BEG0_9CHLR|nr:trypsin-like peptidase domain-containing protein [Longilinea arvoryzae]GAP12370.1 trypsin-like serine protease, typically periplasmic, contain C-terminal PDZ domain [Longilinea arvoryzae]